MSCTLQLVDDLSGTWDYYDFMILFLMDVWIIIEHRCIMYGMEYVPLMYDVILYYIIILVYMLVHINIFFDLR